MNRQPVTVPLPIDLFSAATGAEVVQVEHRRKRHAQQRHARRHRHAGPRQGRIRRHTHRPHRAQRHGSVRHSNRVRRRDDKDWIVPLAILGIGAVLLSQQPQQPRRVAPARPVYGGWDHIPPRNMRAHDDWCDLKYRSYSRSTKTFQPYNGPRRYCNSPYDLI